MDLCGGFDHKYGRLAGLALRVNLQQQTSCSRNVTVRAWTCVVAMPTRTVGLLACGAACYPAAANIVQQDRDCARMDLCGGFDHKYGRLADLALRANLQQQSSRSRKVTVRARTCVVARLHYEWKPGMQRVG